MTPKALVVIASRWDSAAQSFAERYADHGVHLMTPEDLSQVGWKHRLDDPAGSTAVVAGRSLSALDIVGVVTRLPYVAEYDLFHIVPADRAYVAAEMSAFLLAWLKELKCPLLNRPTPQCLSGPYWRQEKWVQTAGRLGIPVFPVRRQVRFSSEPISTADPEPRGVTVTIVGQRQVGTVDQALGRRARALAEAAGVDLLAVRFSGPEPGASFIEANLWPDLGNREIAEAVLQYLQDKQSVDKT